ncbi:MAG: hypothetical protein PHX18_07165 [Candidatus Gastranaerophilales bacterium]|nr:hypothetical protein [Candidatus Gastranaerophilales bacterium]
MALDATVKLQQYGVLTPQINPFEQQKVNPGIQPVRKVEGPSVNPTKDPSLQSAIAGNFFMKTVPFGENHALGPQDAFYVKAPGGKEGRAAGNFMSMA